VDQMRKVYVEPTTACNLNCRTCVRHVWDEPEGFMEWSTYEAVVDGLVGAAGEAAQGTVAFMGLGEPLLHPRFLDRSAASCSSCLPLQQPRRTSSQGRRG